MQLCEMFWIQNGVQIQTKGLCVFPWGPGTPLWRGCLQLSADGSFAARAAPATEADFIRLDQVLHQSEVRVALFFTLFNT